MGGMYTSKRILKDFPRVSIWNHNNGVPAQNFEMAVAQCVPTQTTYSYRSYGNDTVTGTDDFLARIRDLNSRSWLDYSQFDTGHPFDTVKQEWDLSHKLVDVKGGAARYRGPLIIGNDASLPITTWFPGLPSFDSNFYGTKLMLSAVPTKPVADMAVALGELRQKHGIPSIPGKLFFWEDKVHTALQKGGGEYLNLAFGWRPLLHDIKSIMTAVVNSEEIMTQYLTDSGKAIYRYRDIPVIHSNLSYKDNVVKTNLFQGLTSNDSQLFNGLGADGRVSQVTNHDRTIWLTAQFSYYLSSGIDPLSQIKLYAGLARKVLGIRLTPEVLWELAPWSWLYDWFFNIGSVLQNIENFRTDGLVARYAYLMCTDVVTTDTTSSRHGLNHLFGEVSRRMRVTHKQRVRATPYGFGLDPTTWSPERWAVLAALGMTKSPNALR